MQVEGDRWQVAGGRWQVAGGHLIIGPVGEVGWVHLVLALGAGEALPVVGPWGGGTAGLLPHPDPPGLAICFSASNTLPEHRGHTSASPSSPWVALLFVCLSFYLFDCLSPR